MSKIIDAATKCIEFNGAVADMLEAREPTTLHQAHARAIEIARELSLLAQADKVYQELVADTLFRGAIRIEMAATMLASTSGKPN
jgi:hypothetical protein